MRGVSLKFVVLDEYADMKPAVFEQILRPALADLKGKDTRRVYDWRIGIRRKEIYFKTLL